MGYHELLSTNAVQMFSSVLWKVLFSFDCGGGGHIVFLVPEKPHHKGPGASVKKEGDLEETSGFALSLISSVQHQQSE